MITSTKNPRIVQARKLSQRKHRQQQNRFLVEGLQLLSMAVEVMSTTGSPQQVKVSPHEVFYSEALFTGDTAPRLLAQLTEAGAEAIRVSPQILDILSERDTSQGLAVTFALSQLEWSLDELKPIISLSSNIQSPITNLHLRPISNLILILDKLQDPGNLGTLIRTADATGVKALILLEPCVDPFDPKTVRSTMGSIFTVPLVRIKNPDDVLPYLSEMGYYLVGADARQGQTTWQGDMLAGAVALVLGNEARGLSPELHQYLADYVSLPLHGYAESLNVSIAGGVLMYEWLRINTKD